MNPRLTAIAGRLKGSIFSIEDLPVVIGRETNATLCIADASVSRRHSQIEKEDEQFVILDLDSLNGTFVNDVPVKRRTLQHGDRVRIGDSQFLFLMHDGEAASQSSEVEFDEGQIVSGSTLQVRFNDALYLMARDLSALMKVSTTINAIRGMEELQKTLLELLFEVVPAERGAILLVDNGAQGPEAEFTSVFGLDRRRGPDESIKVSRTITKWVLHHEEALLISNQAEDKGFGATADSLTADRPGSVLCVPLVMLQRTLGVIYLDTREPDAIFDKDHLQLVSAISAITAVAMENARHIEWLVSENQRLIADFNIEHNLVGESPPVREVLQFIAKVAPTDSTVLLSGESGTGKELAARAIHQNSKRAKKSFMAVNCAALAESLLESELFGHEKGSFTGALAQKKGRLEIADGGTVFLDEIGELSPALQVKLLRVLQEREFERVGGTRTIKIDIRLITATNKNLEEAVNDGTFRQDLYYRLNVVSLEMPPLRDRQEDIPLLAKYFAAKYGEKCNRRVTGISAEAQARLRGYDWPGNVRELENALERAVVLGTTDHILLEDLPESVLESEPPASAPATRYHEAVAQTKRQIILNAMQQAKGSYTEAAKLLGVHPNYLHRLIRNLNLKEQLKK
ncbi:MAG TPA: sigma-54-dependent Fis family transcriptional regulator [Blastocatellia bacterium]|jgi:Nif-specific regulatory protein|nr:sigma-54-dependent Fis family transcriptional regulator [Blastocatellia bacterium]HCX28981.1 sigma-54-dependent Fis family transcriptional regulator [Blastocatellia bacterium]